MGDFDKWDRAFREQNLYAFNNDRSGLLWLKVRSVCRAKLLDMFLEESGIRLESRKMSEQFEELFGLIEMRESSMGVVDKFLRERAHEWYVVGGVDERKLRNDLYKVRQYEWGGGYTNSLDKHFVSHYVKEISDHDVLESRRQEIALNAWRYVETSWYNNWTSYLLESIFKRHRRVVPAVGEIKSVDFFIDGFPIDLKVTNLPSQYMGEEFKARCGVSELVWLKSEAKRRGIVLDGDVAQSDQLYILQERLASAGHGDAIEAFRGIRSEIVEDATKDNRQLLKWLYTNQGEMRFGAENRIFIILADLKDMSESWKMKRAFDKIEPFVNGYLDDFDGETLRAVRFRYGAKVYHALADTIFIIRD